MLVGYSKYESMRERERKKTHNQQPTKQQLSIHQTICANLWYKQQHQNFISMEQEQRTCKGEEGKASQVIDSQGGIDTPKNPSMPTPGVLGSEAKVGGKDATP